MTQQKLQRPATIYDVAELAGVSHQTVSRHLKGFAGIRPDTRSRVEKAIRELNYRPNLSARALATNRSQRIAVLTSDLLSAGPAQNAQGLALAARDAGYIVDIIAVDADDQASVDNAVAAVKQQYLAGIIVMAVADPIARAVEGIDFGVPVYIDSGPADLDESEGHSFNALGMELIVDHLVELGHRSIVHLAGPRSWVAARNRARAFEARVSYHGLPLLPPRWGDWTAASAFATIRNEPLEPTVTALACANDQMALGAVRALVESGKSVPGDVSVTGFDDIAEAAYFLPPLTTVRIDFAAQGAFLFDALRAQISGAPGPDTKEFMQPELMPRNSVASAHGRTS